MKAHVSTIHIGESCVVVELAHLGHSPFGSLCAGFYNRKTTQRSFFGFHR